MAARKLGLEGVVRLSVRIDGEGRPVDVKLAESSGRWDFDASAMEAVAKWRFAPGKEWIEVTIEFKLTD
jgi:protein TonB